MALSTVYRFRQHSGLSFGAGHLIDVLRGKVTDKTTQHGHGTLSHLRHRREVVGAAVARRDPPAAVGRWGTTTQWRNAFGMA